MQYGKFRGIFLFFLYFIVVESRLRPMPRRFIPAKQKPYVFPKDVRPKELNHLQIPNKDFCQQMESHIELRYLIIPWWYHYCENLRDNTLKKYMENENIYHHPVYKVVMNRLKQFRRSQALKNHQKMYGNN